MEVLTPACGDLGAQADRLGYLYFPRALDAGPLEALRAAVLAHEQEDWVARQAAVMVLPEIDALRRDPFVLGTLAEVFGGEPVSGQGDVLRVVRPGDEPTPPHRDADYVRDERLWTVWIPLGDCPLRLGGLAVHAGGGWASVDYSCGDVLMFAAQTLHRAAQNRTDRVRVSVDFRYVPSE